MRLDHFFHFAGKQILDDLFVEVGELRAKLDRAAVREEQIMADLTRLNAAIANVLAYINTLKTTPAPEDPAIQAGIDAAATELESALPPATPPA